MKSILYLTKALVFWLFFFFIQRFIFIAYNHILFQEASFIEIVKSLFHGLQLDWSTSCYLLLIPFLFLIISFFSASALLKKWNNYFAFTLILVMMLVTFGNTLLYKEWQSLLSKRALSFLLYPAEIMASLSFGYIVLAILTIGFLQFLFFSFWKKRILFPDQNSAVHPFQKLIFTFLTPALLVMGARGGFQLIPINESAVYFSRHTVVNHTAVNPVWYLGSTIWNTVEEENKYYFMNDTFASQAVSSLFHQTKDSSAHILKSKHPNVVLIVLESHTADVIEALGGEKNVCPQLDNLAKSGILFTQIYGSGSRTDQGIISILSAFPSQPDKSIIKYTAKVAMLPSLYKSLGAAGYHSSFYYGGEIEFANIGAYLRQSGVDKIVDKDDFVGTQINSKWGAHDEFVLSRQLDELKSAQEPFFSVLLTLSNHEPFETPENPIFKGDNEENRFRSTAAYTDKCLGNYFREAAKTSWYSNTLFILVADHGHRLPQQNDMNLPKAKHIPLLFLGEVIQDNFRGLQVTKVGNQQDIAATLLYQLEMDPKSYTWSKNLLNENTPDFAYYSNENVLGWITAKDTTVYSFIEKKNVASRKQNPDAELKAQAYLQKLYTEFLKY